MMTFSEECRQAVAEWWDGSFVHPFVTGIGDGSLPIDRFSYYVVARFLLFDAFCKSSGVRRRICRRLVYDGQDGGPRSRDI